MKGRKLRLLVLNDIVTAVPKPRLLSVVKVPDGNGKGEELPCIQNLHQHMQLWAERTAPDFDLLLIDINFEHDGYAPYYFSSEMNPYGLLHALPLAARQGLTGMPFVWDIHTGQPKLQDDPVAQFAFALLAAMERRTMGSDDSPWSWNGYVESLSATHFRDGVERLGRGDIDERLDGLVRRYREKLIEEIGKEKGGLWTDLGEVKRLQSLLAKESRKELATGRLLLYCDGHPDQELNLQSLFADVLGDGTGSGDGLVESWPKGKAWEELKLFVQSLQDAIWRSVPVDYLYGRVRQMLTELPEAHEMGLGAYLKGKKHKEFILIGVVICCWLERHFRGQSTTHKSIKEAAAIDNDHTIRDNLIALDRLRMNYTGQQFIDSLSRVVLPQPFKRVGDLFWTTLVEQGGKKHPQRPRCIEEETLGATGHG
jgi:hypothetical protein